MRQAPPLYLLPVLLLLVNLNSLLKDRGRQALSSSLLIRTQDPTYYMDDKKKIAAADVRRGRGLFTQHGFWHPASTATPMGPLIDALGDLRRQYGKRKWRPMPPPRTSRSGNLRPSMSGQGRSCFFALTSVPLLDGLPPRWDGLCVQYAGDVRVGDPADASDRHAAR